jgi:hypothetical protein
MAEKEKGCEKPLQGALQTIGERNQKRLQKMESLSCLWIGRINIVNMTLLTKAIYMFNIIPIKIPRTFFTEIEISILMLGFGKKSLKNLKKYFEKKYYLEQKNTNNQSNPGQKNNAMGIKIPNFKQYYTAIAIKP